VSPTLKVSRGVWLLLGFSVLTVSVAWFARDRWRPVPPPPDAETVALTAEVAELRDNTDTALASWRKRRAELEQQAWTRAALDALVLEVGPAWHWEWTADDRAAVICVEPHLEAWARHLALLDSLRKKPGLILETVTMRASGLGRDRRFSGIRIELRVVRAASTAANDPLFRPTPSGSRAGVTKANPNPPKP
jgi:hypothetical protein